ncbi:MAG: preprotein translocase subunit SecY [Saprospiraceae bacterium]|jgi:preprotein translocase subunit SecY|uniref:Protein translocase subunit SecY n=1 Tax=Candidatus Defluviibacterium haderslevense TaxID=2981993 RepID=A0A9D7SCY6_9BACT|nr:preprotein translocase subunit SecY [Candidatus Defluviibacterium haderslevense]MCI1265965.1 preprotein translocase subunit SecY [Saprospiraceae bacterium]MBK7244747.1 preprotein translocase subunit SecY [Candidatus Defluviibacterium haderslevense]MBK8244501.1 preprotein translocase subunit SecY [Candidatus Defluviibacterium haderslevense]MBK9719686.1 preprotein translocase subunit SecY [Candidatus Defluviibacterium haderslevense]
MKNFFETFKNIWSIKELRDKILFTIALLAVFRLGSFIVLPGVVPSVLENASNNSNSLFGLINTYTGGAFNKASIFALGIMPYITSSIIIQLLGFAVPYFQRLQQKEGESGRRKLNQFTRILTVFITLVQGGGYLTYIQSIGAVDPTLSPFIFWFSNSIILATGTIFAMWLGERITDRGIGNGVSMIIMIGIISALPSAFTFELQSQLSNNGLILFILELVILFLTIIASILIVQGVRKIPIQFAKRMVGRGSGSMPVQTDRDYIPLKVNAAGVMPIIFAQAIMFLPLTAAQYVMGDPSLGTSGLMRTLTEPYGFWHNFITFVLVVGFTYVYTALIVNPQNYAEYLKRNNAFIPGVKPGLDTEEYIDTTTTRITLPGSIFLGFITILPAIAVLFGVNQDFARFFGGSSILILVGVVLDTLAQIESYLLMRKYDGLVKSGRIEGRTGQGIGPISG